MTKYNFRYNELKSFIDLCKSVTIKEIANLRLNHEYYYRFFDEVLSFSVLIRALKLNGNIVEPYSGHLYLDDLILQAIKRKPKELSGFMDFAQKFCFEKDRLQCRLSPKENIKWEFERRLLKDMGLLSVVDASYVFNYPSIFNKFFLPTQTLDEFKAMQSKKEDLGTHVEHQILHYELEHLKNFPITFDKEIVRHISPVNVCAGYDIESYDKISAQQGFYSPIYIEVKTISSNSLQFYWSQNEVNAAKRLNVRYHLYLAPIDKHQNVDFRHLMIIADPYKNIFLNKKWSKDCLEYFCHKENFAHE